jgi:EmrB/QacA subfamily drug resistance transporter
MSITTSSNRKWWVLAATSSSLAMVFLDQSALPIALPSIQRDLGLSHTLLPWVINAYVLALAVLIILGGKLGDKLGHRKIFLSGMILFIGSSILCALTSTGEWLIASRALQGIGGALMIPTAGPLFRSIVGPEEFGKMIGLYVSIASVFLIFGPTLGGFLTTYLNWRWIFWINFPVAFAAILITVFLVPKDVAHPLREKGFDWLGFISLSVFVICLVFAFMQGDSLGWTSALISSCFFVATLALFVFIKTEQKHPTPFVDFSLFKDACISRCVLIISLVQVSYMSFIFWAIFLQNTLFLSSFKTGVYLLSAQVPVLFCSAIAGRMLDRFGPRLPVSLGTAMLMVSSLWIAIFCWQHNFSWLFPALLLFGIGSPLISIGVMSTTVSKAPSEKRGVVSGITSGVRQIGGAIGLAFLVALMTHMTNHGMLHWLKNSGGALARFHPDQLNQLLNGTPLPGNLHLNATELAAVHTAAINAYTLGFSCVMFVVAFFSFISFWIARKLPNTPTKTTA